MNIDNDELWEAEYKLQNCIRVTLEVESYKTEVNTGKRWVPVTEYVEALLAAQRQALRDEVMSEIKEQLAAAQTNLDYQTNETHNENLIREWQGAIQGIRFCEEAISTIFEDKQLLKGEGDE